MFSQPKTLNLGPKTTDTSKNKTMGLFNTHHHHFRDNSSVTNIRFPETIQEHKAPTDESIRLMEEMHEKAIKNIIARVEVKTNLVSGEAFVIHNPIHIDPYKAIFKFKINDQEFTIEAKLDKWEMMKEEPHYSSMINQFKSDAEAVIMWFLFKKFSKLAMEKILGRQLPEYYIGM